jgi:uncharacterized protein
LGFPLSPAIAVAALLTLIPLFAAGIFPQSLPHWIQTAPLWIRLSAPCLLCAPYVLVTGPAGVFAWRWLALYAGLPVAVSAMLWLAERADTAKRGDWRDGLVLMTLGLAVDLRWFEGAWPAHLSVFNKMILLDAGIYAFTVLRKLDGVGFDLRLKARDAATGLHETALYTPIALALGLGLGFLHLHTEWPGVARIAGAWIFTFFFIAIPEELFFRGWIQNLLERRMGRMAALLLTSALFGLSHFNKRTAFFNWEYVLMAALAGVFYGRAWRRDRRVGASAITHATVDAIWSLWLR